MENTQERPTKLTEAPKLPAEINAVKLAEYFQQVQLWLRANRAADRRLVAPTLLQGMTGNARVTSALLDIGDDVDLASQEMVDVGNLVRSRGTCEAPAGVKAVLQAMMAAGIEGAKATKGFDF